jgi:hypothetical protein
MRIEVNHDVFIHHEDRSVLDRLRTNGIDQTFITDVSIYAISILVMGTLIFKVMPLLGKGICRAIHFITNPKVRSYSGPILGAVLAAIIIALKYREE